MKKILLSAILLTALNSNGQLYINNGTLYIDNGAVVTVSGDVESNTNIQVNGAAGTGKLVLNGTSAQSINMNGNSIPNLEVNNTSNVNLTGAAKISSNLNLVNGKIILGTNHLTLSNTASVTGNSDAKYVVTNGTGELRKEMTAAGTILLPIGNMTHYAPLQYVQTGGTYNNGYLAARNVVGKHPNAHIRISEFLNSYWNLSSSGISGGTRTATGTYHNSGFTVTAPGVEADINAFVYNGTSWSAGTAQNATNNTLTANVAASGTQQLYGMNKFILAAPKAFLQGPYNSGTGLMNDQLRNSGAYTVGTLPASNLIPLTDPYRSTPYSANFSHVNNGVVETISSDVLKDLASPNNQIVDWVFVELREATSATAAAVQQTRAALLQRDGDIVDIDGESPLLFKNLDPKSTYVISVRHRNHLGISTNPAAPKSLNLNSTVVDLTSGAIYGTANTNYALVNTKNLLYAGNSNANANVRYTGPSNDKDYLLSTVLSGNGVTILSNVYNIGDVNMNRNVRYSGPSNDKDFILTSPLSGSSLISKSQLLPN